MLSSAFGTMILGFAALLWCVLQLRWRLLLAEVADGQALGSAEPIASPG